MSKKRAHHTSHITHQGVQARRAFTLIETLVAISILLLALAGPLSIASQALQSAYYARDQVTAFYLAQEAVEYVRAVRDQNYLAGNDWLTGVSDCVDTSCTVDFPNFSHTVCSGACPRVLVGETNGLFNHEGGTESIYRRAFTIQEVGDAGDEIVISVTVSWRSGTLNREFTINEHLFDWLAL